MNAIVSLGRKKKLSASEIKVLSEKLRRRQHLLEELAQYDIKRLAHEAGVSRYTVTRLDYSIHGHHKPDPLG